MTTFSNITFGGYPQASGSHFWFNPLSAFDGFLDNFWQSDVPCTLATPVWISYHWEDISYKLAKYRLFVNETQRPTAWTLQSSDNGIDWIDLDDQVNQTGDIAEWLEYEINTNQYYQHFRLLITTSSDPTLPVRISEIEFISYLSDITTTATTTTVSTSSTQTSSSSSSTTTTATSTHTTTWTTGTTFTSTSTTSTEDPTLLWKAQTKLDRVRDQINEWYETGIPVGIRTLGSLPTFHNEYIGIPVYISSPVDKYYLGTTQGWEELNLGTIRHGTHHVTEGDDELIHLGLQSPSVEFPGKVWIYADYSITTTLTTTTTTVTTTTTTLSTASTTSTITYTYTTTQSTTTTTTATTTSTITQSNYTYNVLPGCTVSCDSFELGYDPGKAIDNLDWTKWLTNSPVTQNNFPHWIKFILSEPKVVYVINLLWDFARYAENWYLEGSNDGYTWDTIYYRDNYLPIPNLYNQHTFYNTKAFVQYRIRFISGNDLRTSSIGIFVVQLLADAIQTTSSSTTTTITSTSSTITTGTTTATTTQLGYMNVAPSSIVVAIDQYPDFEATKVVDNNENSYWICDPYIGPPYWVMFYWPHGESYVVDQYKLFISSLGRPRDWRLQGSLDGFGWSDLDSRYNEESEGWWSTTLVNTTSFKYYRILIEKTQSTGYSVRLGSVELWINQGYRYTTTVSTTTATTTYSTTSTTSTTLTTLSTTASSTTYPIPSEMTLLMNFNGANLSTQESDDTNRHHGIQWFGGSVLRVDDKKYGSGSLYLPYTSYYPNPLIENSYLSLSNSHDWQLGDGTGDFTIDFWIKWRTDNNLSRNWNNIITYIKDINNYWSIRYYPEGHLLSFILRQEGLLDISYNVVSSMIPNMWNYLVLVRLGNNFIFFMNGTECDGGRIYDVEIPYFSSGNLWIGRGPSEYLNTMVDYSQANCYLDSLRISVGSLVDAAHELPPEPTTSTTVSTTTVTTTTTSPLTYSTRLSLRCNDGESYAYDYSGNHGIVSLVNTNTTFASRFAVYTDQFIYPRSESYLFSCYSNAYDFRSDDVGYLQLDNDPDWRLGDNGIDDFTIEAWIAYRSPFFPYGTPILSQYEDYNNFWCLFVSYRGNKIFFKIRESGVNILEYSAPIDYDTLEWNYFSFNKCNGRFKTFWNGSIDGAWVDYSNVTIPVFSGPLYIFGGPSIEDFTQIVSAGVASAGLRITKGIYPGSTLGVIPIDPL